MRPGHSRVQASTTVSTRIARPLASRSWTKSIAQHSLGRAGAGRAKRGPTGSRLCRRRTTPSPIDALGALVFHDQALAPEEPVQPRHAPAGVPGRREAERGPEGGIAHRAPRHLARTRPADAQQPAGARDPHPAAVAEEGDGVPPLLGRHHFRPTTSLRS